LDMLLDASGVSDLKALLKAKLSVLRGT
jgi:hypothetical protein